MCEKQEKSLKLNMILNAIKGLMGIVFPLISFPYVSKVLSVESIGQYNFAHSVISYFILIAGLGIATYAVREGSRFRGEKQEFQQFANEVFTVNVVSAVVAYALLAILMVLVDRFKPYHVLILIFSLEIIFRTIGIEWIYSIYEDFTYITIRSIVFQFLSLIALFLFVKKESDVWIYAAITVFANAGSNILNYIHSRKYCKVKLCRVVNWKRHLKPIMVLFAMSATVTIYTSSGTTILGLFTDNYCVGIYAVSGKIYSIVKTILSSILIVSIPRLSSLLVKDSMKNFEVVAFNVLKTLLTVMVPATVGIVFLRKEIVLLISDAEYIRANESLAILAVALLSCMGTWFWAQCILVPLKQDNIVLKVTIISAIANVVCNLVLIPIWQEKAAALSTLLSETISLIACAKYGGKYVKLRGIGTVMIKIFAGCMAIAVVCIGGRLLIDDTMVYIVVAVGLSIGLYFAIEVLLKNEAFQELRKR